LKKQEVNVISKEHEQPSGGHRKHTALVKPSNGNFGRNEWAIVGGYCITIKLLADQLIKALSAQYKCAYADAAHNDDVILLPGRLASDAVLDYTDQVNYQQFNYNTTFTPFRFRQIFADADLIFVNGNHHQAKAQVVIIDNNKQASLLKRVGQLTNVELILLADNADDVFDFIKEAIPNWQDIPVFKLNEVDKIMNFFAEKMTNTKPILNGLVLAGGKSTRMGFDKGTMYWHGKEQRYYMADMLKTLCSEVFISRSSAQQVIDAEYATITDTFTGLGPYGAILSAFREQPDRAWLVIACDLPLLDENTLQYLIENRDSSAIATAYQLSETDLPEPLITIWEPKSYPVLLSFLAQGYSCPRKVLINSTAKIIQVPDPAALTNVNTTEDAEKIKNILHQKTATP
jgi:molybdopterin-guanine dinucleotide biosynthesis protein A